MLRVKVIIVIAILLLAMVGYATAFETKSQDCSKCHTLTKDEASDLLKNLAPDIKILDTRVSPSKALWEVFYESGGKKGLTYIDFSKDYLFSGQLISIKDRKNLTQESFTALNKVDVSQIPLNDALVLGDAKARIRVIVFTDPDCPYCAKLHQEMKKIVEERKDIVFYIKMFPLKIHPEAYEKSKAIVCEKSLALLEDAFSDKPLPKPSCDTKMVDETMALAEKFGISGTPTSIMPDGRLIPGSVDAKTFINMISN